MYCEKCCRVFEGEHCPVCKISRVREPAAKDPCFLTEQDYLTSGMLEDMLKQEGIPYLKKEVMGAGLSIRVGPMLDRSRFYVAYDQLPGAVSALEELFPEDPLEVTPEDAEEAEEEAGEETDEEI